MVALPKCPGDARTSRGVTHEEETLMSTEDRIDPASARAHAVTLLAADRERVARLERDLDQARRDVEVSRRLAAQCGAVEASR